MQIFYSFKLLMEMGIQIILLRKHYILLLLKRWEWLCGFEEMKRDVKELYELLWEETMRCKLSYYVSKNGRTP